jgi:hypothetical protein
MNMADAMTDMSFCDPCEIEQTIRHKARGSDSRMNASPLVLRPTELPSLANKCYLVGQTRRAGGVWSRGDFFTI